MAIPCRAHSECLMVVCRGQPSLLGGNGLRGPRLPQLAPPPRDAEVTELEEEVSQTAKRIAEFRTSMHTQLMAELGSRLAAQRPDVDTAGLLSDEQNVSAVSTLDEGGCSLDALAEKLENVAAQCPSLRAQLEETLARLTRILGVVRNEMEHNNAGPTTVEKVLLAAQDDDMSAQDAETDGNGGAVIRRLLIQSLTD